MMNPILKQSLLERYQTLKREIHYHNYRYHVLDAPVISDSEFDRLMVELHQLESENPEWIASDSPSQRTGGQPADRFVKLAHPAPILSLANAFSVEDIKAWQQRILKLDERVKFADYLVDPKIDGLTVVLHYKDGIFTQGATRGDGEIGEDITANLRTIRSLPLNIPVEPGSYQPAGEFVVRGEAYINIKDFERLNRRLEEAGEKTYLNPRNTAAGSLRQLDPTISASRPLNILIYQIVSSDGDVPNTQWEQLEYLRTLGFPVAKQIEHFANIENAIDYCLSWIPRRHDFPFEVDGMVIKINDLRLSNDLGFVGKDPRGAIAFKFPSEEVTTIINNIGVNVGRTGVLTPYAMLEPVDIGGVVVKQATLHNFDYIQEKDIRIGDRVRVKRAGDVIPYVIGPITEIRNGEEMVFSPPLTCPACGQPVDKLMGEVAWYCVNSTCPEQLIRNLEHFVSRGAMDIVGLGIRIVEQLVEAGYVKDVADLYTLTEEQLAKLDGFAKKRIDNLLTAIDQSRKQSLSRLITALGIRGVGEIMAYDLANQFNDLDELNQAETSDLLLLEGVGPNTAQAIVDWFHRSSNQHVLEKLRMAGVWPKSEKEQRSEADLPLEDLTFVVTGTLPTFSREEIKTYIQRNGGKVTESVTKKTSYLVVGDNPGSKLAKAQSFGVPIIDENALRQLVVDSIKSVS